MTMKLALLHLELQEPIFGLPTNIWCGYVDPSTCKPLPSIHGDEILTEYRGRYDETGSIEFNSICEEERLGFTAWCLLHASEDLALESANLLQIE